jgi:hypothetical protein
MSPAAEESSLNRLPACSEVATIPAVSLTNPAEADHANFSCLSWYGFRFHSAVE